MFKTIGKFVAVSSPTIFLLIWSFDAPLMVGADVFIIALLQFIFLGVYMGLSYRSSGGNSSSESPS